MPPAIRSVAAAFLVTLISPLVAAQTASPGPPPLTPAPAAEPPEPPPDDPVERCLRQLREGRQLLQQELIKEALLVFRAAVDEGLSAQLAGEVQATLHSAYGLALGKADEDDQAVVQLRLAAALLPSDVEIQLDLAAALLVAEQYGEAKRVATAALRLQPTAEQTAQGQKTLRKAQREYLKERLSIEASVEVDYDSNIEQGGTVETIAGRPTRSASRTVSKGQSPRPTRRTLSDGAALASNFSTAITDIYTTPTAASSQAGVPIEFELAVDGRLAASGKAELWLGYAFSQLVQTLPDQDSYNFQDHHAKLRLDLTPSKQFKLTLSADGFANFSGLQSFSPFQGGIAAALEATLREGKRWRTLLRYTHKYSASFSADDAQLNSDSDELGLAEELRLRHSSSLAMRARLGYRLRSLRSGSLTAEIPYDLTTTMLRQTTTETVGSFLYTTPLGYLGNQVALMLRGDLPHQFTLRLTASYEYRAFSQPYTATFEPAVAQLGSGPNAISTSQVTLPATLRRDSIINLSLGIKKELGQDFYLGLDYSFLDNRSNIANSVDNRSYLKHTIGLTGGYSF